jgi:hypothetical protein
MVCLEQLPPSKQSSISTILTVSTILKIVEFSQTDLLLTVDG